MRRFSILNLALLLLVMYSSAHPSLRRASRTKLRRASSKNRVANSYIVILDQTRVDDPELAARELFNDTDSATFEYFDSVFKGFSVSGVEEEVIQRILDNDLVVTVEEDQVTEASFYQAYPPWGLDRIDQEQLPLDRRYHFNWTGLGVDIYIFDTGILATHDDFGGRAKCALNTIKNETCEDLNGHGTHVSGIAGGRIYGVAKQANIFAIKVLDTAGAGTVALALWGLDYVVRQAKASNKTIICNMSLSATYVRSLNDAIHEATNNGVFVTVAAGNGPVDACDRSPSSSDWAFTVGATESKDRRTGISNYGTCLDLFAPGHSIKSDWIGSSNAATNFLSGTSMASPFVAGVAALYIEKEPHITTRELRKAILSDAATGKLYDIQPGSPNLLLNTQNISNLTLTSSARKEKIPALAMALSLLAVSIILIFL